MGFKLIQFRLSVLSNMPDDTFAKGVKYPQLSWALGVPQEKIIDTIDAQQGPASDLAKSLGGTYRPLDGNELSKFARSFERQFVIPFGYRDGGSSGQAPLLNMYIRHFVDCLMGAGVMKYQTTSNFGGEIPGSGEYCMQPIRAAWFGVGNDWDVQPALTGGAFTNWIHAGTSLMAGTSGNDVRIGPRAVHVVFGWGEQAPAPKVEELEVRFNGTILPGYLVGFGPKLQVGGGGGSLQVKEFDDSYLLRDTSRLRVRLWSNDTGNTIPYLIGTSYLIYDVLQNFINPANLPGTTQNVILTT